MAVGEIDVVVDIFSFALFIKVSWDLSSSRGRDSVESVLFTIQCCFDSLAYIFCGRFEKSEERLIRGNYFVLSCVAAEVPEASIQLKRRGVHVIYM